MKNIFFLVCIVATLVTCKNKEPLPDPPPAPPKFSVIYNGNGNSGGTVPADANKYENGATAVVLKNNGNLVKTGYTFIGWNTRSDGTGIDYLPESTIAVPNSDITLYAKWWNNSQGSLYTVKYNGNGNTSGTAPTDNATYTTGAMCTIKTGNDLIKSGSAFKNWNTSSSGNGQAYTPGSKVNMQVNLILYAIYETPATTIGKYYGFNASGQMKSKSSLTSSWYTEDINNTFGSSIVAAVWNGSNYIGFNASGQVKSKSSATSAWYSEDLNNTFGSLLVAAVWDGSKYIGFNASGQVKSKSSLSSSWTSEDLNNTFGSNVVAVIWNGSKYIGFNESGQVKSKSSLSSSWISEDLNNTFGSSVVAVVWNGSEYVGFNASGQLKSKSSLSSSWTTRDLDNTFGSLVVTAVYH